MAVLAQNGFTVRRIINGKTIAFRLSSNMAATQTHVSGVANGYYPVYSTTTPNIISPSISVEGDTDALSHLSTWKEHQDHVESKYKHQGLDSKSYRNIHTARYEHQDQRLSRLHHHEHREQRRLHQCGHQLSARTGDRPKPSECFD